MKIHGGSLEVGDQWQVHEHGFVKLVDLMGDDAAIVQAARVSYGDGTKTVNEDRGLIRYLLKHSHTTPFEMCDIKLHLKMPMFVARQWVRHRTASMNEVSARYSELPAEFYVPNTVGAQSQANKQGTGEVLDDDVVDAFRNITKSASEKQFYNYTRHLRAGVSRELARINLPLNTYTEFYWKMNLHNLLHFLRLRCDSHAQKEIRDYADVILYNIVKSWVPHAFEAFMDYKMRSETFSETEMHVLRSAIEGTSFDLLINGSSCTLSKREKNELRKKLGR